MTLENQLVSVFKPLARFHLSESLELEDFEVGELPGSTNFGTVSFET